MTSGEESSIYIQLFVLSGCSTDEAIYISSSPEPEPNIFHEEYDFTLA